MEIKKQVVSLELSKKLKELGVEQKTFFKWNLLDDSLSYGGIEDDNLISAFSIAELGEILKPFTHSYYSSHKVDECWIASWGKAEQAGDLHEEKGETEADARAKMLIYLLENNLISHA